VQPREDATWNRTRLAQESGQLGEIEQGKGFTAPVAGTADASDFFARFNSERGTKSAWSGRGQEKSDRTEKDTSCS